MAVIAVLRRDSSWTFAVFYTCPYNHARRLRLEKLLYLEVPRSPNGFFLSTSGFRWRFRFWNRRMAVSEVKRPLRNRFGIETVTVQIYCGYVQRPFPNGHKCPFGCNGYVTAVAPGRGDL